MTDTPQPRKEEPMTDTPQPRKDVYKNLLFFFHGGLLTFILVMGTAIVLPVILGNTTPTTDTTTQTK
tara:strand:- start:60 stop:260 length:201 start_codon:yes stop_codon:yes gene_type:complete